LSQEAAELYAKIKDGKSWNNLKELYSDWFEIEDHHNEETGENIFTNYIINVQQV